MNFISILMIGIGLSMDAFAVSLTMGLNTSKDNRLKIALRSGLFFGIFQGLMPLIGWALGINFTEYIQAIDHWIAFALLSFIGGKMVYESIKGDEDEEKEMDFSYKRFLILAIATSIDALAVGVSFAFLSVNIFYAAIIIACTTFLLSIIAVYIGRAFGEILKSKSELIGGIILVIMGIKILIEHLSGK
ncbi:Putative Mn2+ efflux pump MntP [Clostridium sp. DSM 8431]|uniref:manganese efflux pump MntP n=1 Tax=Clostridium sp. DSM 8431 TaxID=1761781 RepID=UPI0008F0C843|nr:manganese efflux pump MntP family protein [Clostridium sp. DSM 8431]SFU70536.1 Putative Mn2+ efflux pump MntP [Clostridium sp. DSM 8431]